MDADTLLIAQTTYAEGGSLDYDTMVRIASTILNRLEDKPEEFGETISEVINKKNAYYAVQNKNDPWMWATTGEFPNKDEEARFKQACGIAYGLRTGRIERQPGHFFFTPKEVKRQKRKKSFDFSLVEKVGGDDNYQYFSYPRQGEAE